MDSKPGNPQGTPGPPLPAFRSGLEAFPIVEGGKTMFVLRDLEGINERALGMSPASLMVASLLDGRRTAADLQTEFAKLTGSLITSAQVQSLVSELDRFGLLETEAFQSKRRQVLKDFLESPVRKAMQMGGGYPDNPLDLARTLGEYLRDPKGPGALIPEMPTRPETPVGIMSPHIDLMRGGPAYAWAYRELSHSPPPDAIVALGVAHMSPRSPWVMTKKKYDTTHGPQAVHEELYQEIAGSLWYDPLEEEWAHRTEHSLEFQAVWLRFLWKEKTPPWVPILCSSFERFCPDRPPSAVETVEGAIRKIGEGLARRRRAGQRILILAGVDLAHVGPRFGDAAEPGPELEKKIEEEDRASLEHALKLEADPFYLSVVKDGHWRKVCGLSATYTALRWMKALSEGRDCRGRLLTYGQAPDPLGGIVSFAGAIFE